MGKLRLAHGTRLDAGQWAQFNSFADYLGGVEVCGVIIILVPCVSAKSENLHTKQQAW
jgi:hypothetical protein